MLGAFVEDPGGVWMVREKFFEGRCQGVGHTVGVSTFKLLLHPRLSYGQDFLDDPEVAWALLLFLLRSLWLSTQMATWWLLGTEKMALESTRFLQVSEGE